MRERGKEGFSLIEVLIALSILAVGLLAVGELQVAAIRSLAFSRHMSSATQLGEQELEYLRSLPYDPLNELMIPTDAGGNNITSMYDGAAKAPFWDGSSGTQGDGLPSVKYHCLAANPVNAQGNHARRDEISYYIRWTIERGPLDTTGTFKIPGIQQMRIHLQVIWWEGKGRQSPSAGTLSNWNGESDLRSRKAHWIDLETTRQVDL